ncbi:hypothetical protein EMA8858_03875 [Emticicia aquatica]|uniref:DUF4595 domain-containing protein n=1 Tax=Emticicia aquatica TaxID=1681835 RepID=A0ABN8F0C8_9BACT|nr:hypothetical protein [Emticicia aquatica]CAH0997741.1 hypothetical protein EMA8858_03875 [Emticicia aquatica]
MKYISITIILLLFGCKKHENINPTSKEFILLKAKIESTTLGSISYQTYTEYFYDTLTNEPKLIKEITDNLVTEYMYPSDDKIILNYRNIKTNEIYSTVELTIDPITKNVTKYIDENKTTYLFEYDTNGYLLKNPLESDFTFEYKDGNLKIKKLKTGDYSEEFSYNNDKHLNTLFPYFLGKPNTNLLSSSNLSIVDDGEVIDLKTSYSYILLSSGYIKSEKKIFPTGAVVEADYEYLTIKK